MNAVAVLTELLCCLFPHLSRQWPQRALLESVVRLHCRAEVLMDLGQVLGPVEQDQMEAYSFTHESEQPSGPPGSSV